MVIEQAKQAILRGRKEPFATANGREGPVLFRPLMEPCLLEAFELAERRRDTRVIAVGVNTRLFVEMRKFTRMVLDIETHATLLRAGLQATLWGAMVLSFASAELGDDEIVLVDEDGRTTRLEVAEGYPHEVKIEVCVRVDAGEPVRQTIVVPFAEVEHLDELLKTRFPDAVAQAVASGVRRPRKG